MGSTLILDMLRDEGYREVAIGVAGNISNWLQDYFAVQENMQDFVRRNDRDGLEIMKTDRSQGYVFVGPFQPDRDYESGMENVRKRFEAQGKRTLRYFVDKEEELAGFSWKID